MSVLSLSHGESDVRIANIFHSYSLHHKMADKQLAYI